VSFTSTFFASSVSNPIYVERGERYAAVNLREPTTNRGVEFLATWRKNPFAVTTSYTYVRSSEIEPGGRRADVPLTPRHNFGLVGFWEQEGKGRVGLEYYYTGHQRLEYDPYNTLSRGYSIVGALAERSLTSRVRLFVNFENLTNVRQTRWSPLIRTQRGPDGRWTVDGWAPLEGRVVNGGVRLIF
jgi:iron complex outermembrane receptor protein